MSLKYRMAAWIRVIYSFLLTLFGVKADILSAEETALKIKDGRSLIRFGDGEFGIYRKRNIHYQRWSEELLSEFERIKRDYENDSESCPYILAVPKRFMTVSGFRLMRRRVYVSSWAESRLQFKRTFRRDIAYGDAFLFEKKNRDIYGSLWDAESAENVIFVHNSEECAEKFRQTYKKNVYFVKCPPRDAFESVDAIEAEILEIIKSEGLCAERVSLAISAGPAGKVLVYRFSRAGYHAIDAGHCWDEPLEGI